jgi:hypothetical protein
MDGCVMERFFLGTHQPGWLWHFDEPMFVSDRRLRHIKRLPRAAGPWALDSGGFTELSMHGSWDHGPNPAEYADRVRRYQRTIGNLAWVAPQDWMTEPSILARTGLTVAEHQTRTVDNLADLRALALDVPWTPVVQGQTPGDYIRHVELYAAAGIDLTREPLVGVGSVCRRQGTTELGDILHALHDTGLHHLHGFGLKKRGLTRYAHLLDSADSLAWSYEARRAPRLPECQEHKNCANCPRYAFAWRRQLLAALDHPAPGERQPLLVGEVA